MLTAATRNDIIVVIDSDGGIWWPSAETSDEIRRAENPEALAVEICESAPMRGTWKQ